MANESDTTYDWAQAIFEVMMSGSEVLHELVKSAHLDAKGGDLRDIDLTNLDLSGKDLCGWDLRNAKLGKSRLSGTDFRGAKMDPFELVQSVNWKEAILDDNLVDEVAKIESLIRLYAKLLLPISGLELSVRASTSLKNAKITYLGDLVQNTNNDLLRIPNFGRKSLNEVKNILADMGLHLEMELNDWPPENLVSDEI